MLAHDPLSSLASHMITHGPSCSQQFSNKNLYTYKIYLYTYKRRINDLYSNLIGHNVTTMVQVSSRLECQQYILFLCDNIMVYHEHLPCLNYALHCILACMCVSMTL